MNAFMGNFDIPTAEHVLDFLEQQSTLDWLIPMSFDASVLAGQALIEAKDILREIDIDTGIEVVLVIEEVGKEPRE